MYFFGELMFRENLYALPLLFGLFAGSAIATESVVDQVSIPTAPSLITTAPIGKINAPSNNSPCKPMYPAASLRFGEEGVVRIAFTIGADGLLISTKILKSSGYSRLDQATLESFSHCRFKAAVKDGKPIESTFTAEWIWKIDPERPIAPNTPTITTSIETTPESKATFNDINQCQPVYPPASVKLNEQGKVKVRFTVGADAQLISSEIVESSGYKNLDNSTVAALSRCKFKPKYEDGKPIESTFTTDWVWKIDPN
jgi:protein TonB